MEPTPELINEAMPELDSALTPELINEMEEDFYYGSEAGMTPELYGGDAMPLDGAAAAGLIGMVMVSWLIALAIIVITIIAWWKIFTKAGREGWKSIIPFYNVYVMLEIVGMQPLLVLVVIGLFIPFVNIIASIAWFVIMVMMYYKLSLAFGKGMGYTLGLIFLNPIFALMLAFGDAKYTAPEGVKPSDPTPPEPTPEPAPEQTPPSAQ